MLKTRASKTQSKYQLPSPLKGWLAWQYGCSKDCHWMFWPDLFHKMIRRQAAAFNRHEDTKRTQKMLMKLFRSSRAPFGTSKFGCQVKDAKQCLVDAFSHGGSELLEMLWPRIADDLNIDVGSLTIQHLSQFASR